jgi:SagB-type dehydrogenase family enzyme
VTVGRRPQRSAVAYRRSPHLVAFWRNGTLRVVNYATRKTSTANPLVLELMDGCAEWRTLDEIRKMSSEGESPLLQALLERLVSLDLFERSDRPSDPRVSLMDRLAPWNPEAGFFHSATRDVAFTSPKRVARHFRRLVDEKPMPALVKTYRGVKTVALPKSAASSEFPAVLKARRTWRRFSALPITLEELSTLLGFTAGVQKWAGTGKTRAPLKTSPSGGARHPIECYVVVRDVEGLAAGVYHYSSARHALERIRGPVPVERIRAYVPTSEYFARASAMVFFTAVFGRIMWRYPYSRAYRAALVEAGHFCQTFCLTATWKGLAPYCLMALADSLIEEDLGLDGITEAVLYAAGVGRPPRGSKWAPLPKGTLQIRPNTRL